MSDIQGFITSVDMYAFGDENRQKFFPCDIELGADGLIKNSAWIDIEKRKTFKRETFTVGS